MYHEFNKESLFFLTDQIRKDNCEETENELNLDYLSQFLSEFQFLIYYVDPSLCNNIVYLNSDQDTGKHKLLKHLFPYLNFYFDYQQDLKTLTENGVPFCIISNSKQDDMDFQKAIIEKYQPYAALLDFYRQEMYAIKDFQYLDGLLLNRFFQKGVYHWNLVVAGIGYKTYNKDDLTHKDMKINNIKRSCKFMNPFSKDNKTIFKERGFYNSFDQTATVILIMDYLSKNNQKITFNSIIKILIYILDNLIENKKINLDLEIVMN
jgi:hypothetical protein